MQQMPAITAHKNIQPVREPIKVTVCPHVPGCHIMQSFTILVTILGGKGKNVHDALYQNTTHAHLLTDSPS